MRITRVIPASLILTAALMGVPAVSAQSIVDTARPSVAQGIVGGSAFSIANYLEYITAVADPSASAFVMLLQRLEATRSDKQEGATSSAPGTTTLVSKGTVPKILGLAVENGAIMQSQSGTSVTLRTNAGGAAQALANRGFVQLVTTSDPALTLLKKVSGSVTFDTSRGNADNSNTFTGDQQQVSQWTGRFEVINHRDPNGQRGLKRWDGKIDAALANQAARTQALLMALTADAAVTQWETETVAALATLPAPMSEADVAAVLKQHEATFPDQARMALATRDALREYQDAFAIFVRQRSDVLDQVAAGALVSVEVTGDRPLKTPALTNVRLIGTLGRAIALTGNASMTYYNQVPKGLTRQERDFQAAGQIEVNLGTGKTVGVYVLSFAGKYAHQFENSIDDNGAVMPNTSGTTAIGQVKLTLPINGATKVPLSITFANRSDLIKESIVRANVGITYDLDSVFANLKP